MSEQDQKHPEDESYSDYIRVLSHQLKSPINSIQSLLNTISEGFTGEVSPKTQHFIEKAVSRASEAKEIITDLLDYEFYSREQELSPEEIDLNALLNALVEKYATTASEKDISLHVDIPLRRKIQVQGDVRGLDHGLRNLVENAMKYTPAHGIVTIKLGVSEETRTCHIEISDTGYGIPEDELEHIFTPFYRSIKHKANIAGTGLGLPIARRVITNHNGTITVRSQENKGTTFKIILPYLRVEEGAAEPVERTKVVIIGGITAGPKAAARLRRLDEDLAITIIEKSEFLSYSGCGLPSYISDKVRSPKALMSTADNTIRDVNFFESIKNIHILSHTSVEKINREQQTVTTENLENGAVTEVPYDILILATGSELSVPKIPGIRQQGVYSLHNLEAAEAIKKELSQKNAQDVIIVGGGLIGISTAESLIETGARITILEKRPHILLRLIDTDIAGKLQNELNKKGIKVIAGVDMTEIERTKNRLIIHTSNDAFHTDLIILSSGLVPNSTLAQQAGLEIGQSGEIRVSKSLQTSDEQIYAIGDCAENINRLTGRHETWAFGSVSTKMGRIAADNICAREKDFYGSVGTAMFKIFDLNIARTGLTLQSTRDNKFDVETVVVTGLDKTHYYEDAENVILKVIADKKTKRILGAQGYGKGDIVPKIQMLACAITQLLTLNDMFNLDLGHAPPFNTPIDIVQTACLVLENKIDQLFDTMTVEEFEREKDTVDGVVDVSPLTEHTFNSIPGSLNIPLENIRREGLPFGKTANVILYSKTSSGAYEACRYLTTKGYSNLRVLEGGYVFWER